MDGKAILNAIIALILYIIFAIIFFIIIAFVVKISGDLVFDGDVSTYEGVIGAAILSGATIVAGGGIKDMFGQ